MITGLEHPADFIAEQGGRKTRGLAAPLATLASPNPAPLRHGACRDGPRGVHLAAASAVPGAGFASRGIVKRPPPRILCFRGREFFLYPVEPMQQPTAYPPDPSPPVLTTFVPPMAWSGDDPAGVTLSRFMPTIGLYQTMRWSSCPVDCYGRHAPDHGSPSKLEEDRHLLVCRPELLRNLTGVQTAFA